MQTERLYYDYADDKPFAANISGVRQWTGNGASLAVVLDRTIFYPEGGGQPGDRGTINGCALTGVIEQSGELLHIVGAGQENRLAPGPAELVLDARRRRDFTVQHSAQHLLSGTLLRLTKCYTVSMHLGDEINTIDLDCPQLPAETLSAAEDEIARAIEEDCPYIVHFCPPEDINSFPLRKVPPQGEEIIRVIEIQGRDFSPCCGTHCKSSGQIGIVRVLGAEKYKGMTRISFIAGMRVLEHHRMLHANAGLISRGLKVPPDEIGAATLALLEKANALEKRIKEMETAAAEIKARALVEKADPSSKSRGALLTECYSNEGIDEVLCIGRAAQKLCESVVILASEKDLKFAAFCSVKNIDIRPLIAAAFEKARGKGGGGPSFFQGQFSEREELAAFLAELGALA